MVRVYIITADKTVLISVPFFLRLKSELIAEAQKRVKCKYTYEQTNQNMKCKNKVEVAAYVIISILQ